MQMQMEPEADRELIKRQAPAPRRHSRRIRNTLPRHIVSRKPNCIKPSDSIGHEFLQGSRVTKPGDL